MTAAQVKKRDEIGRKILNMWRRGGDAGAKLRTSIKNHVKKKGWNPSDRKTVFSFIWAMATDYALTGREFGKKAGKGSSSKIERPPAKNKKFGTHHNPHQERLTKGKKKKFHSK